MSNDFPVTLTSNETREIFNLQTIRQITFEAPFNDGLHDCLVCTGMKIDPNDERTERLVIRAYELPTFIARAIAEGFYLRTVPAFEESEPPLVVMINPMGPFLSKPGSYTEMGQL